jgi:hypothetical protein
MISSVSSSKEDGFMVCPSGASSTGEMLKVAAAVLDTAEFAVTVKSKPALPL